MTFRRSRFATTHVCMFAFVLAAVSELASSAAVILLNDI